MSPRTVLLTAIATTVAVIAATFAVLSRPDPAAVVLDAEPAFVRLREAPEAAATIEIAGGDAAVTLVRAEGGGWTVTEKSGYPAKREAVAALLLGLAELRLTEAKTARPERYARLGVEDVDAAGSASRRVRVLDGKGEALVDAIVGRRVFSSTGGRTAGTYLRRSGDVQAWLASGGISVEPEPKGWLAPDLLDIEAAAVRRVTVAPAQGEGFSAARDAAEAPLTLADVPEGRSVRTGAVERLARMLEQVSLVDVAKAGTIADATPAATVTVETFDGQVVRIELATAGTARWATFTIAGANAGATAGDGAAAIAAPVDGWTFQIAASVADRMAPALEDLLEPVAPAGGS